MHGLPGSGWGRGATAGILVALGTLAVLAGSGSPTASAARVARNSASAPPDGLGIAPGKIKHVWLIILENKSYDATFTGLNNNTYLWRTLPAAGRAAEELLRHRALQLRQLPLDGQRAGDAARQPVGLPVPTTASPARSTRSGALRTNPNYGQMTSAQGPNARSDRTAACTRRACRRCSTSSTRPRQLEGLRPGSRQPRRERSAPQPGPALLRRPVYSPRPDRQHARSPTRRSRTRPTSTCPSTSRFRGSSRCCGPGRLQRGAHRQRVRSAQRPLPRPAARVAHADVQLDHAEHVQRRPRRGLLREQPSGGFSSPTTPEGTRQLHRRPVRRRPVPSST